MMDGLMVGIRTTGLPYLEATTLPTVPQLLPHSLVKN